MSASGEEAEKSASDGSILFIGNATVLIRCGEFQILTDPTFIHKHEKVAIGYGLHSTRLTNPALEIHQLPAGSDRAVAFSRRSLRPGGRA